MTKLNLGSKHRKLEGFDNLDKIFGWNFQDGLPKYQDGSVEAITISHALMFLTETELEKFVKEMKRVLRVGGVVRITEDDTENPKSSWYKTGNIKSGPSCLTGPKMMRKFLEKEGFIVYDVDKNTTQFYNNSLIQAYRGSSPSYFFIEAVKPSKLTQEIKNKGRPYEIPDCSRDELPKFFRNMGYKIGAEIGVHKGAFTEKFCQVGLTMYAIDPWAEDKELRDALPDQEQQDLFYEHTQRTLAPYKNCTIIRKASMNALADFKDSSLDFVYIDADHRFSRVAEDVYGWYAKVKRGGAVSGHDYFNPVSREDSAFIQVKPVIDAFVDAFKINRFYTFGLLTREKRKSNADRHLSWMIIKE